LNSLQEILMVFQENLSCFLALGTVHSGVRKILKLQRLRSINHFLKSHLGIKLHEGKLKRMI
jgi:hypothetical protein